MIEAWVASASLVVARVATMIMVMPIWSGQGTPRFIRAALAVSLASLWIGESSPTAAAEPTHWLIYGLQLGREVLLGAAFGFAFNLILMPGRIAGAYVGQEAGLTLAQIASPSGESSGTIITQAFDMLSITVFLITDAHHVVFATIHASFARWPIGSTHLGLEASPMLGGVTRATEIGLLIAAPMGVCLFITVIGLSVISRAVPQLNLFSFGLVARMSVVLLVFLALLPQVIVSLAALYEQTEDLILGMF